jgi:hypothetical protein
MVNAACTATGAHAREAAENVWPYPAFCGGNSQANIPVARGVSDGFVTDVTHLNEHNDWLSSQVAILVETDVDLHLRQGGCGGEQQEQTEGQLSPHGPMLLIH